jgi:pantetheine-phosphate adenylyltransferase
MSKTALYPGTFDPITLGHIDVIERASMMFDKIIVVIAVNPNKTTLFSEEERLSMARDSLMHIPNIEITSFHGLIVEFAKNYSPAIIIRGLRAISDFEYEFQMALMNRKILPDVSTIFLMPHEKYTYLNSSIIRELASYGQDVSDFVPEPVLKKLKEKFGKGD